MFDQAAFDRAVHTAQRIQTQTGFLPSLDDSRLEPHKFAFWADFEGDDPLDDLIRMQSSGDPASRAAAGSGLYFLLATTPAGGGFAVLVDAFLRYLDSTPVESIADQNTLRWELHAAGAVAALDRVLALATRAERLAPTPELRSVVAANIFRSLHPAKTVPLDPSSFDPFIREPGWLLEELSDLTTYVLATTVERRPDLPWEDPASLNGSAIDALITADALLQRILYSVGVLTPTQQAMLCWFRFALGAATKDSAQLSDAGSRYGLLPAHPLVLRTDNVSVDNFIWKAAALCFGRAHQWLTATDAARRWSTAAPKDAEAHRFLAQALYKQERLPEAVDAFERYMKLREDDETDWEANLLLRFGLELQQARNVGLALESAAFTTPFRRQGEALTTWFAPWFETLTEKAKERWWTGVYTVSSPHLKSDLGDARWDQAATCFGEAVNFELKERVFLPFAKTLQGTSPPDRHWAQVLGGKGTLGEAIECLLQTRVPQHQTGKLLAAWLQVHRRGLRDHLGKSDQRRLLDLAKLRGQAAHDSSTEQNTRRLFSDAEALLKALTSTAVGENTTTV